MTCLLKNSPCGADATRTSNSARSLLNFMLVLAVVVALCTTIVVVLVSDAVGMRLPFPHLVIIQSSSSSPTSITSEEEDYVLLESTNPYYTRSQHFAGKDNQRQPQDSTQQTKLLYDTPPLRQPQQKVRKRRELKLLQDDVDDVDCSKYQHTLSVTDTLRINYVVNVDESSPGGGTFNAEMIYLGKGWLGFAHSEQSGMVGSTAIIGLPDAPQTDQQIQKYILGDPKQSSPESILQPLDPAQQTLLNTSLIQNDNTTVMRFTKLLSEPSELTIHPDWPNKFLFAHGSSNEMGMHATRGLVVLDLVPCFPSVAHHLLPVDRQGDWLEQPGDPADEDRYKSSSSYVINVGHDSDAPVSIKEKLDIEEFSSSSSSAPAHVEPVSIKEKLKIEGYSSSSSSSTAPIVVTKPEPAEELQQFDIPEQSTVDDDHLKSLPLPYTHPTKGIEVWWTVHGFFSMLSFGVLLPVVIASSILQGCCGTGEKKQSPSRYYKHNHNKIYRWSNFLLILGVLAAFISAVIGATKDGTHNNNNDDNTPIKKPVTYVDNLAPLYQQPHGTRPQTYHSPAGLALFIVCLFFAFLGNLRSYLNTAGGFSSPSQADDANDGKKDADEEEEGGKPDFNSTTIKSSINPGLAGNIARCWDQCHSLVGVILLFVTWWQCQSGLDLFRYRFAESWFTPTLFWGVSGTCAGLLGFACILQLLYLMIQWCFKTAYW